MISVSTTLCDAAAVLASAVLVLPWICFYKLHVILRGGGAIDQVVMYL